jgi:hypothetical protein
MGLKPVVMRGDFCPLTEVNGNGTEVNGNGTEVNGNVTEANLARSPWPEALRPQLFLPFAWRCRVQCTPTGRRGARGVQEAAAKITFSGFLRARSCAFADVWPSGRFTASLHCKFFDVCHFLSF